VNLQGKVALVTGGGTGLGKEIALQLAAKGCHVAVNYSRSADDANETAAEI
jgi:3-oxoacyl-[acyl-carrier protein] reductase